MPQRVGVDVLQRKLTLADAIELALKNNLDIEIEKSNTVIASQALRASTGYLDPTFRFQPGLARNNTPTGSVLQGSDGKLSENGLTQNFYFNQRLPWQGSRFGIDFENNRLATNNPFVNLNPYTTSRLAFNFTQPLLRGRLFDRERTEVKIRRKNVDISEIDFELKTIDVVTRVQQAYWDLVAARQDVEVQADTVEWAREQLARNKRQIDAGTLAPVEIAASEAELERRLDTWYAAVGVVTEVENNLKTLLASDRSSPIWTEELLPTAMRNEGTEPPAIIDLRDSVDRAIASRVELRAIKARQQVNDIEKKQNADLVKPQVNLVASYTSLGLGGSVREGGNPFSASNEALYERVNRLSVTSGLPPLAGTGDFGTLPGSLLGGYGTTLSNLFSGRYQSAQVGLSFDFTFRNNTAEANLAQTAVAERRLKLLQAQTEQVIESQVRNALQAIQTARQRITAAEASARAAKEKLDSEIRLFQTGESTNFLVLTRQNEFSDSRRRAVVAQLDFNKAVARLEQALGSTLNAHNVTLK